MIRLIMLVIFLSQSAIASRYDLNLFLDNLQRDYLMTNRLECSENQNPHIELQSCLESLCGVPNTQKSIFITSDKIAEMKNTDIEKQFSKDKSLIEKQFKDHLDFTQQILFTMASRFYDMKFSSSELSEMVFNHILPNLDIIYDQDQNELSISHDQIESLSKLEQEFIHSYINNLKEQSMHDWELAFKLGMPIQKENLLIDLIKMKNELDKNIDNDEIKNQEKIILQGQLKKIIIDVKTPDLANPKHDYQMGILAAEILSKTRQKLNLEPAKIDLCKNLDCDLFYKEKISSSLALKSLYLKISFDFYMSGYAETLVNNCKGLYYFDQIENEAANKDPKYFSGRVKQTLKYLKEKYSQKSTKEFEQYIKKGLQVEEKNKNAYGQSYIEEFKKIGAEEVKEKEEFLKNLKNVSDFKLVESFLSQFQYGLPIISNQMQLCKNFQLSSHMIVANDFYDPMKSFLKVSNHSCSQGDYGADLLPHELGHVFSDLVSKQLISKETKKIYIQQRNCINSQSLIPQYKGQYRKWQPEDHFRSEEDMADYFSAQVANLNRKDKEEVIIRSCAFMKVENNSYSNISLENSNYDNHSSSALRILREAKYKGITFPSSCQQIIDKNKHLFEFKNCQ